MCAIFHSPSLGDIPHLLDLGVIFLVLNLSTCLRAAHVGEC